MKILGLDFGQARIGVALGEIGSSFVFGRGIIKRGKQADDVQAVQAWLEREGAERVVLGLPQQLQGGQSKQSQRVKAFARALNAAGIATDFEDERFTSIVAQQHILASGISKKQRQDKGRVDEAAAVLILESYLAKKATTVASPDMLD